MKTTSLVRSAWLACAVALVGTTAHAQFVSDTIFGTGLGSSPGGRDSNWKIVAVPGSYTPPSGQTVPYDSYVPYTAVPGVFYGGGNPQTGLVYP